MTVIEIRPHRWGSKAFEAADVEPCVPKERSSNRLCADPRVFSLRTDSDFRFNRKRRARHSVRRRESKAVNAVIETHKHRDDFKEF
jgi:hypothetical protein